MADASSPPRDAVFWLAVRAAYAAGVPADRASSIFDLPRSTLLRRARKDGWLRRDLERQAEGGLATTLAAENPSAEDVLRATHSPAALAEAAADAASIVPKALAAADAALTRATEAAASADAEGAETASKLGERLARMANVLGRTKTPQRPQNPTNHAENRRSELLEQIDRALEGDRAARRIEVDELKMRSIDPREAWLWDDESGEWVWDPGGALARATARLAPVADRGPDAPGGETQD